ncbi:YdcF family protein [Exiguobacterium sp. MMG028]|uniref:YdcF family protein n=1 Tax=Exiguobacterium sp. MMG028 TaxID=3021979 RepID=UPI0022FDCA1D|nr:YdcF family protein [Exiguobacterium sp. MMG028]MDA5560709.1 YdcF family protein [Exiguobacterium sp. MMG028]
MRTNATGDYRFVLILGAKVNGTSPSRALRHRIDVAVAYAKAHPYVELIATGGKGPDEEMAEALVIERELMACGIEPHRIHVEATSTSTIENFQHSRPFWEGETGLTIVTNDFHVPRARLIAKLYFQLESDALYAPTPPLAKGRYVIREVLAYVKLLVRYLFKEKN